MGQHNRFISFSSSPLITLQVLKEAIQEKFADVLQPGQEFFMQLESDKWGGKFLDVLVDQEVADRSVVKIFMKPMSHVS